MSGRRVRNVLLLAIVGAIGYWIYKYRPTPSGIIDSITQPLFGSKAAIDSSEHNRVRDDASTVVTDQTESRVTTLKEGMYQDDVRELLGKPDSIENFKTKEGVQQQRWTYRDARRVIVFQDRRVRSLSVL